MKLLPSRTHRMLLLCVLVLSSCTTGNAEGNQMSGTMNGTRTHCLGRYLIDLPADAIVSGRFEFASDSMETKVGVSADQFEQLLAARESALRSIKHKNGGDIFSDRIDFRSDRILLQSWSDPFTSRTQYQNEYFGYFPAQAFVAIFKGRTSATAKSRTVDYYRSFSDAFRYRAATEVPSGVGFCFDHGFITDSELNNEEFTASIRLNAYPSVTVTLMSYVTGKPDEELLKRVGRIPPGYEEAATRMKSLRRGDRNIGPVKGQELLVRGDAEGKRSYQFLWEAQGRANSLEFPFMSLELSTTDQTDEDGEIIVAPFKTDEEALRVWDAILDTLRLRPGAV
ncbi:T6SS immunity protein Tli4 family protein [Luteimonas sp. A537]